MKNKNNRKNKIKIKILIQMNRFLTNKNTLIY